jgi:DNA-directed RNA polymerase specialized sigma24 family protein
VEGYNHIEAARLLNENENTIRSRYSRARAMLIQALKKISEQTEKQNYAGRI